MSDTGLVDLCLKVGSSSNRPHSIQMARFYGLDLVVGTQKRMRKLHLIPTNEGVSCRLRDTRNRAVLMRLM